MADCIAGAIIAISLYVELGVPFRRLRLPPPSPPLPDHEELLEKCVLLSCALSSFKVQNVLSHTTHLNSLPLLWTVRRCVARFTA